MLVVLDTNVLFQGLSSDKGASFFILELLNQYKIQLALSNSVVTEYESVLKRKQNLEYLNLAEDDIDRVLAFITYSAKPFDPTFLLRPNLRDEADNIFVELAFASESDFLITGNIKDFSINSDLKIDSFTLITPANFVRNWRKKYEN